MSSFQVALAELNRIHTHIHQIAVELRDAEGNAPQIHNQTGYGKVEASIHHFFEEWSDGMKKTKNNLTSLGGVLSEAEDAYRKAEAAIVGCANGKGD